MEWTWIAAGAAALIIGIAKTSFGGLGSIAVALLALALPTKESTAAALLLLITGDIIGVMRYRRSADWSLLRALLPSVVPGILLGALFINVVDDLVLRRSIGAILLTSVLIQLVMTTLARRRAPDPADAGPPHRALTIGAGVAAGFTTMAANAAGPVMAVYLQLAKVEKMRFLGTSAWFYFIVNVAKTRSPRPWGCSRRRSWSRSRGGSPSCSPAPSSASPSSTACHSARSTSSRCSRRSSPRAPC